MASTPPPFMHSGQPPYQPHQVSQQQTMPSPAVSFPPLPTPPITPPANFLLPATSTRKKKFKQVIPFAIAFILVLAIIGIWFTSPGTAPSVASPGVTQQNFGTNATATNNTSSGSIRVYIVGAVKNPGVYTLDINARVYDLLQAAGGPQAKADLVALNLAAKLTDGEEVYVTLVGEVPPTYMGGVPGPGPASGTPSASGTSTTGQLVNINTASADDMRLNLHVSSTTAQNIVNFRLQHGPYTSVDQLLQVVSKSIYDKIKGQVTV